MSDSAVYQCNATGLLRFSVFVRHEIHGRLIVGRNKVWLTTVEKSTLHTRAHVRVFNISTHVQITYRIYRDLKQGAGTKGSKSRVVFYWIMYKIRVRLVFESEVRSHEWDTIRCKLVIIHVFDVFEIIQNYSLVSELRCNYVKCWLIALYKTNNNCNTPF